MQMLEAEKIPEKVMPFIRKNQDKTFVLLFPHGLGDVIMWYPFFEKLKAMFPNTRIDLELKEQNKESGYVTFDPNFDYDYKILIHYWTSDNRYPLTKNQLCNELEMGMDEPVELFTTHVKRFGSPIVSLGFTSGSSPESYGCPKDIAKRIYDGVLDAGFIPMAIEFKSEPTMVIPRDYSTFIKNSTRECAVKMRSTIGLIQRSHAFIGVTSGPMWVALACLGPDRCMCLDARRDECWKVVPLDKMRFTYQYDVTKESVSQWLKNIPETDQI